MFTRNSSSGIPNQNTNGQVKCGECGKTGLNGTRGLNMHMNLYCDKVKRPKENGHESCGGAHCYQEYPETETGFPMSYANRTSFDIMSLINAKNLIHLLEWMLVYYFSPQVGIYTFIPVIATLFCETSRCYTWFFAGILIVILALSANSLYNQTSPSTLFTTIWVVGKSMTKQPAGMASVYLNLACGVHYSFLSCSEPLELWPKKSIKDEMQYTSCGTFDNFIDQYKMKCGTPTALAFRMLYEINRPDLQNNTDDENLKDPTSDSFYKMNSTTAAVYLNVGNSTTPEKFSKKLQCCKKTDADSEEDKKYHEQNQKVIRLQKSHKKSSESCPDNQLKCNRVKNVYRVEEFDTGEDLGLDKIIGGYNKTKSEDAIFRTTHIAYLPKFDGTVDENGTTVEHKLFKDGTFKNLFWYGAALESQGHLLSKTGTIDTGVGYLHVNLKNSQNQFVNPTNPESVTNGAKIDSASVKLHSTVLENSEYDIILRIFVMDLKKFKKRDIGIN